MENLKTYFSELSSSTLAVHIAAAILFVIFLIGYIAINFPGLFVTIFLGLILGFAFVFLTFVVNVILEDRRE